MVWNDPLTTHLLDFLFELEKNGLEKPLIIAGGFGLFLRRQYLAENKKRTLLKIHGARSTEDIDIFIRIDILCNAQQAQTLVNALNALQYKAIEKFTQWEKQIDLESQTGTIKMDFLIGNIDNHREQLHARGGTERARNPGVEGFHARITSEAFLIDEKSHEISLSGKRSTGEEYEATICIPHPFTYLIMKLFAFHDRQDNLNKQHHAFDIFTIIGLLTEQELEEAVGFGKNYTEGPIVQKAKQIVKDHFTGISPKGMVAIRTHSSFQGSDVEYNKFLNVLMEIFGIIP